MLPFCDAIPINSPAKTFDRYQIIIRVEEKLVTWVVCDAIQRGSAHSDGNHAGSSFGVEDDQVAVGAAGRQGDSERMECQRNALVANLGEQD